MKVNHKTPTFQDVAVGDAFINESAYYIKIEPMLKSSIWCNAICLTTGDAFHIYQDAAVFHCPDAEVTL